MNPIRIALCQIGPGRDPDKNIERACAMVKEAAAGGAGLVMLPEIFYFPYELAGLKKIGDMGRAVPLLAAAAREHSIFLCTGSLAIHDAKGLRNTSFLIGPRGETILSYSKCHLFEASFSDLRASESSLFVPGDRLDMAETEIGKIGMLICYDIRFPEMARLLALKGAELILVPAVFNHITGPAHWHVLLRARAVENQVFVAAASQARVAGSKYRAFGHSMAVSPWGDILAEAGEDETIVYADLKPDVLEDTRNRLPVMKSRRKDLYS